MQPKHPDSRPIGIFDSGAGGLTIWRELQTLLPNEGLLYVADGAFAPYGDKSPPQLVHRALAITRFLLAAGAKLIVVACNTATVHVLARLRAAFPLCPFVGVAPVVKPLAAHTRTGEVALLSTPATAASSYLAGLIREFASGVRLFNLPCPGLAARVDMGDLDSIETQMLIDRLLAPMRGHPIDAVGLGCTHYGFLRETIGAALGPSVAIIDAAVPVARRAASLLETGGAAASACRPIHQFFTTGNPSLFTAVAGSLLQRDLPPAKKLQV